MPLLPEHAALRELCTPPRQAPTPTGSPAAFRSESAPLICPNLGRVLTDRRSVRQFANRPVPAALLAGACQTATLVSQAYWPTQVGGDVGLEIAIAAAQVQGLASGIHAFSPSAAGFEYLGGSALIEELRHEYAPAPALFLVCGDLGRARGMSPASSYQNLLIRAAALGQAALLNAMAAGLRGCPFGRVMGQVSGVLSASREKRVHHLFTVAVGWPRGPEFPQSSVA
jgi:hypothetical protein